MSLNSEALKKAAAAIYGTGSIDGRAVTMSLDDAEVTASLVVTAYLSALPSGDMGTLVERLNDLLDQYWGLAYVEGEAGRTTDTPAGDADRVRSEIASAFQALIAERDSYWGKYHAVKVDRDNCSTRAEASEARAKELEKALEPFATAADDAERLAGHDGPLGDYIFIETLRAARAALRNVKETGNG